MILDSQNFDKIIIVCEDRINPVVNNLLKLYPNAIHNNNNLVNDIKIILTTQYLIMSCGTFIPSLMKISKNIKKLYTTSLFTKELQEYYKHNRPWINNEVQRKFITNYKFPVIDSI